MSESTVNESNGMDGIKWLLAILVLAAAVYGNHYYQEQSVLVRAIGVVVLVVVAGFIAASTYKGKTFINFSKEAKIEVRKVVWPTRQETLQTTFIVLAATVVTSLILWGLDGVVVWVVGLLTGFGG